MIVVTRLRCALAGLLVLAAALDARAQVTVLDPFQLRGHVVIASGGVRRALRDVSLGLARLSGGQRVGATVPLGAVLDDPSTPGLYDGIFVGVLARTEFGQAVTYGWGDADGGPFVRVEYQQGKTFLDRPPSFTAPTAPQPDLTEDLVYDLCSMRVTVVALDPQEQLTSLDFEAISTAHDTGARFAATGAASGSDPAASGGFVRSTVSGIPALTGEVLVRPGFTYDLFGTLGVGDDQRLFRGQVAANPGNCSQILYLTQPPPAAGAAGAGSTTSVRGSLWLRRDPADVQANRGPRALRARYVATNYDTGQSYSQNLTPADDGPIAFEVPLPAGTFRNQGSTISLAWPDGRLGELRLPTAPGTAWSPVIPLPTPRDGHTGLYRDGTFVETAGETELATFTADMAFLQTTLDFGGCASPQALDFGTGSIDGASVGAGQTFVDETGRVSTSLTGVAGARAAGTFLGPQRMLELAAIPGPWNESTYGLIFSHPVTNGDAVDDLDEQASITIDQNPKQFQLVAGRANQLSITRDMPLGSVTVTMRVQNADGSLRPFLSPSLNVESTAFTLPDGSGGHFTVKANGSGAMQQEHRVVLVGPPSTVTVRADALVPFNPDGTGGLTRSSFPPIANLPLLPPKDDGSCASLCADLTTGHFYEDDHQAPQLVLGAQPAETTDSDVVISGSAQDGSPIQSVTVGPLTVPLTGGTENTTRAFSQLVALAPGLNRITVAATDACGQVTRSEVDITRKVNQPPVPDSAEEVSVHVGETLTVALSATDPDGDPLHFEVVGITPAGVAAPVLQNGNAVWATGPNDVGDHVLTWAVSDGRLRVTRTVIVHVLPQNRPPVIDGVGGQRPSRDGSLLFTVDEGQLLEFDVAARDPDGGTLTYALVPVAPPALPKGLEFEADTARVRWTPDYDQEGTYRMRVEVRDGDGGLATVDVVVLVDNVNRPPALEPIAPQELKEGDPLHLEFHAVDPDAGSHVRYAVRSAGSLPQGMTLSATVDGEALDWTPDFTQAGRYELTVQAFDDEGASSEEPVVIQVDNVNRAPVFAPVEPQHSDGNPGGFEFRVSDPDEDPLTCEAPQLPEGAQFDAAGRAVRWPNGLWTTGVLHARITCSDGELTSTLDVPIDSQLFDFTGGCGCGSASVSGLALLGLMARRRRSRAVGR